MENNTITIFDLLPKWDILIVDLNRNKGTFKFHDVRLRNCSLHYSQSFDEYYIRYKDITFGLFDIYNIK